MAREFSVIIEAGEDGYLLSEVVGLPGCHTQAKNLNELMRRTKDAVSLYLKCEKGAEVKDRFVGVQKIIVGA